MRPNRLDQAISYAFPTWGARRLQARVRLKAIEQVKAYYDGATIGRRGASIRRSLADPNVITSATLPRLRAGHRDLVRNNPHARRACESIVSNTVGTGIQPHFKRGSEKALDIEAYAKAHLYTKSCDVNGRMTYFGLQSTAFQAMVESGEVLVRRVFRRPADGFLVPVQFQLLEADYLDDSKNVRLPDGGRIIQGVEVDKKGRRVAYWLFPEHPGSRYATGNSARVPAGDIAHIYRADRPGQMRGVPWGTAVMLRMADYADYEDAQLLRQKIAACYAVFVKDSFDGLGGAVGGTLGATGELVEALEPGMIEHLPAGKEVQFGSPPGVDGYGEYASVSLHTIAAGWGVSYESLTGDLKGVNFSSGKMGRLEMERNVDRWRKLLFIPQFCQVLTGWFLEGLALAGVDVDGVEVRHTPPRREMIDPPRELRAQRDAIRSGQKTWTEVIRENGRDPVEHFEEYRDDLELLDRLGIVIDSDARKRTNAGLTTQDADGETGPAELTEALARLQEAVGELEDIAGHPAGASA